MNVYEKIEKLYQNPDQAELMWQILSELEEIKRVLKDMENPRRNRRTNRDYYDFVNYFRERMRADMDKEVFPEVHYHNRRVGVNFKGHLYDKETTNVLPRIEAFALYEYYYEKRDQLESYIIQG